MSVETLLETGQRVEDSKAPAEEILTQAGLNFEAYKLPLFFEDGAQDGDSWAIVRDLEEGGREKLSRRAVGAGYTIIQNREVFSFLDPAVEQGHCEYEACGTLDGNRRVWLLARMSEDMEVIQGDRVALYMLFLNGFDGGSSALGLPMAHRFVCTNQIAGIVGRTRNLFTIRHTVNYEDRLTQARDAVLWSQKYYNMFGEALKGLTERVANTNISTIFVDKMLPKPETKQEGRIRTWEANKSRLHQLIEGGRGTDIPGVRGTFYGLYNAATEYADHEKRYREGKTEGLERAQRRAMALTFGSGEQFKEKAFKLLTTGELAKTPTN
jgi:phage/plasmid-like protein (TIGR03299 family)